MSEGAGLSGGTRIVLVPGVLALLPEYAGLTDPVGELRAACRAAVAWLGGPVEVVADGQGRRVAVHLLAEAGLPVAPSPEGPEGPEGAEVTGGDADGGPAAYLVVANGSACRGEKAPGHLDERAHGFDEALDRALREPDPAELAAVDEGLGTELWAGNVTGFHRLAELLEGAGRAEVDYADDPFGVQYWVMRWECAS